MDITVATPTAVDVTKTSPTAPSTPPPSEEPTAAPEPLSAATFHRRRPARSPSPAGSLPRPEPAVSPPTTGVPVAEDLPPPPAVLNGDQRPRCSGDEEEEEGEPAMEEEEGMEEAAEGIAMARSEDGAGSEGRRYHEATSPVKSEEDSNLGEMLTPQVMPALSPLSPYSSALGLGLPSLLSSASRSLHKEFMKDVQQVAALKKASL